MARKLTIHDLFALKGKRQLTEVFVDRPEQAAACEAAGIDLLVCPGEHPQAREIRAAAPNTFLTVPISFQAAVSEADAIRFGLEALALGADAVYSGASPERVRAMARERIPVVSHVGLVPYRSSWYGGFRAVGKTAAEALCVYRDTVAYAEAGAIAVEMEIVPHKVAAEIARRVPLLVISMGSGSGGDAQYLFACDILGTNRGHVPRHAKVYGNLAAAYDRIRQEAAEAFRAFKDEVDSGAYPAKRHTLEIADGEYRDFMKGVGG